MVGANGHRHRATPAGIRPHLPTLQACFPEPITHSKEAVGMAGFEPAASCSQINPAASPEIARDRPTWRLAGKTLARRRPMRPGDCARWLPLWLPLMDDMATFWGDRRPRAADSSVPIPARLAPPS